MRLGFLADLLSRPILVGYLAGVAVLMIVGQLGKLTGVPVSGDSVAGQLLSFARGLGDAHPVTLVFAASVLAFLLLAQWRFPGLPGPLLAVLLATAVVAAFDLERRGIAVVGEIPAGLPTPALPALDDLPALLLPAAGVLAFDILYGILVAIGLSVAEMLYRVARPHDAIQGFVPDLAGMHDVDDYPQATTIPGLVVYRYDSPLFFANAEDFRRRALAAAESQDEPVRWFVLNAEAAVEVDITGLDALEALRAELTGRGVVFALARVKQDLRADLDAFGLVGTVGEKLIFPTLPTAVAAYQEWRRTHE
jgi:SulP family sulfate permease